MPRRSGSAKRSPKWVQERQLGERGKEGTVYLVRAGGRGPVHAMKKFKATKSAAKVAKEADFQARAAAVDAAPAVVDVPSGKPPSIVMERMERTSVEVCTAQDGALTEAQQWSILALYEALDGIQVLHNDANPLNLMCRTAGSGEEQWRLIDYGFAKNQTSKHCANPNLNMSLRLLLNSTMGLVTRRALTQPPAVLLAALEQQSHHPVGVGLRSGSPKTRRPKTRTRRPALTRRARHPAKRSLAAKTRRSRRTIWRAGGGGGESPSLFERLKRASTSAWRAAHADFSKRSPAAPAYPEQPKCPRSFAQKLMEDYTMLRKNRENYLDFHMPEGGEAGR